MPNRLLAYFVPIAAYGANLSKAPLSSLGG